MYEAVSKVIDHVILNVRLSSRRRLAARSLVRRGFSIPTHCMPDPDPGIHRDGVTDPSSFLTFETASRKNASFLLVAFIQCHIDAQTQYINTLSQLLDASTRLFDAQMQLFNAPRLLLDNSTRLFDDQMLLFNSPTQLSEYPMLLKAKRISFPTSWDDFQKVMFDLLFYWPIS